MAAHDKGTGMASAQHWLARDQGGELASAGLGNGNWQVRCAFKGYSYSRATRIKAVTHILQTQFE